MKALVMESYKKLVYKEVEIPKVLDAHEVLIRVKAAAICGSDIHGFDGSTGRRVPPIIMGHEASGEIVEKGSAVNNFLVGDRVTFDSTIYCGKCRYCLAGEVNLCDNRRVLGVSCDEYRKDGVFAEFVLVPDHILYAIPDGVEYVEAALTEPAAVAAHACRITPIGLNESIAVVGTGLIGLLLIQIVRLSTSGMIIAIDTDAKRRNIALKMGADVAFDPAEESRLSTINQHGFDRVFEAVGSTEPINMALRIVRKGGSVTLIGNISPKIELPLNAIVTRQVSLLGSCAIAGEYSAVLDMMTRNKIDVKSLVSATAPLKDGQVWFDRLYNRESDLLKVVLEP